MHTGVNLLGSSSTGSVFSRSSASGVCFIEVVGAGLYSSGFISLSGREPVANSSVSARLVHLVANLLQFPFKH